MPDPLFFELRIEAVEDFHTGTGTGSGDIDALVARDRRGNPVIRASHLKGLLREAGEELLRLQAADEPRTALDALLGKGGTGKAALLMTSAYFVEGPATLVWGATARQGDDGNRSPKHDTLRMVEYVGAGSVFTAKLRVPDEPSRELLERLLRRVDRIGSGRNRASGLVKVALQTLQMKGPQDVDIDEEGNWLRLQLRNLDPLCLPGTGHPGNLIRTQSFIRGQALRGALIAWALAKGASDEPLQALAAASVGDALPLPCAAPQAVVLPIPLSIQSEKPRGDGSDLPWWAVAKAQVKQIDKLAPSPESIDGKPKRPAAHEYLCRTEGQQEWQRYSPAITVHLRNHSRDADNTKTELFSLEEIAENTHFQADIRFNTREELTTFLETFATLLAGGDYLTLGRGGRPVAVSSTCILEQPASASHSRPNDDKEQFTLTLTSDLILRGPNLGFWDGLDIGELAALAGLEPPVDAKVEHAFADTEILHGFNAASGLRRVPALALRRGSCWRIKGSGCAVLAAALAGRHAIGERTGEGFGRFLVGWHPFSIQQATVQESKGEEKPLEVLRDKARELAKLASGGPSPSQLQWLRNRALAANESDLAELFDDIRTAHDRRPKGGKAWKNFPLQKLIDACKGRTHQEKQQLVSLLVQRLVVQKRASEEEASNSD